MPDHRESHWTNAYRTEPLRLYEMEAPVFESAALTRQEIEVAARLAGRLNTSLRSPIVDLACGPGRHSRWLAERGHEVSGLDHSAGFLSMARNGGGVAESSAARFVCGDLRQLPFGPRIFWTGLLLGKGFGYFSESDNARVLSQAYQSLDRGGFLCVELPDRDSYLDGLPDFETLDRQLSTGERLRSSWRSEWDPELRRLHVDESHLLTDAGEVFWEGRWDVRLYDADEIVELLRSVGFRDPLVEPVELLEIEGARSEVLFAAAMR